MGPHSHGAPRGTPSRVVGILVLGQGPHIVCLDGFSHGSPFCPMKRLGKGWVGERAEVKSTCDLIHSHPVASIPDVRRTPHTGLS